MPSPAQRHRDHHMAIAAAVKAGDPVAGIAPPMPESGPEASEYRTLLAGLGEDLRQLHNIQSVERKIEAKRQMIDRYRDWIEGALAAENAAQDEIVTTMLVWSIDVGDWPLAVRLATHVLQHGLALPERYKRSPATLVAEEVAEAGLSKAPTVDVATLQQVDDLTAGFDMHDQVRAKLKKAIGLAFACRAEAFDPEAESALAGGKAALIAVALENLERALQLNPACGVKKAIEQLSAAQRKASAGAEQ